MTDGILSLARPEIRRLAAYVPASYAAGLTRLNANESPWRSGADTTARGLNRYPEARPGQLTEALAAQYGVPAESLFVTRGTSEAIDLLLRCFCRPGKDRVVICPPTFGMYQVYADIQNAGIVEVPLIREDGFALDADGIVAAWDERCRVVFVTTPNNPTGNALEPSRIERLAEALTGRGLVVVDAAYIEFGDPAPLMALLASHANVVVLRTLSKAYGLAGARCGALIGDPEIVRLVSKVMPPYAIPTPTTECTLTALATEQFAVMPAHIAALCAERDRMAGILAGFPAVRRVWPSDANFLLVEFDEPRAALAAAESAGYLLRDFSTQTATARCLRITIGERGDNDALLEALAALPAANPEAVT
jgi:histidinol-phosphate aminotransferase